jgi:serine/arginine repetitive matrix protein 2
MDAFQVIPSRSPTLSANNNSGTSKIGSRFKKLRGTLRSKSSPLNDEISTSSVNAKSPNTVQSVNYDSTKLAAPGSPALKSALEPASSKVTVPSPPASAGPTLKGFISRFRGKQRASEPLSATQKKPTTHPSSAPLHTPVSIRHKDQKAPAEDESKSPPQLKALSPEPPVETSSTPSHAASPSTGSRQSVMIQQLFDAANNLGLDQNALTDLLNRSGSVTSRTPKLGRINSQTGRSSSRTGQRSETPTALEQSYSGDTAQLTLQPPSPATARSAQGTPEPNATNPVVFRPPEVMRRAREQRGDRAASAVVRRTIILPEHIKVTGTDDQSVPQRSNSRNRRRSSVNSNSLRDRAPTPPPPRSPVGSRFSSDSFPPVPSMPSSLSPEAYLSIPRVGAEKLTSAYDPSM